MDTIIDILRLNILTSLPQGFSCLLFAFSFLQPLPPKLFKRIIYITLIHSLYTDLAVFFIPLQIHMLNTLTAIAILIFIFFREIGLKRLLFVFFGNILIAIIMDIIMVSIVFFVMDVPNRESLLQDNLYSVLTVLYPLMLVTLILSWYIRNRNLSLATRFFSIVMEGDRSTLTKVLSLIILQFIFISLLLLIQFTNDPNKSTITSIMIYMVIAVSLVILVTIIRLLVRTREQAIRTTQEVYLEDINNMFTSIRGQRHDFLNHVQVIHIMAKLNMTEQLQTYVTELVKETHEVSEIVHHASPVLAAFIRAKMTVAHGRRIAFTFELPDQWNVQESSIKIIDIVKIMGNLVDNAFDETELLPIEERKVHTSVQIENEYIQITVVNNGRILDAAARESIFQPGYTTKGKDHSGLGLAIVLERMKYYKGELSIDSDGQNGTLFRLRIPQEKGHIYK